jgi:hypothetical protein
VPQNNVLYVCMYVCMLYVCTALPPVTTMLRGVCTYQGQSGLLQCVRRPQHLLTVLDSLL